MDGWMMDECRWNDRTIDMMDGRNVKTMDGWME